ncbi:MAG: helix-turn-helix domain-containing protein [Sulfolobales archaeon]
MYLGHKKYGVIIVKTSLYKYIVENYRVLKILFDNRSIYIDFLLRNTDELKYLLTDLYNRNFFVRVIELYDLRRYFLHLTDKQEKVLSIAYREKYFERPRGSNLSNLSRILGISVPTVHEHLRKALYKIIQKYFIENKVA